MSINANGYLVVFASGKDRRVSGQNLHTNFSLRAAGESLLLVKPDGTTVVSQFTFGQQETDVSFGLGDHLLDRNAHLRQRPGARTRCVQ